MQTIFFVFGCYLKKKLKIFLKNVFRQKRRIKKSLHSWIGPFHWHPIRWYLQFVGRSSHSPFSWCSSDLLGYSFPQYYTIQNNLILVYNYWIISYIQYFFTYNVCVPRAQDKFYLIFFVRIFGLKFFCVSAWFCNELFAPWWRFDLIITSLSKLPLEYTYFGLI